jgi:cysteine desulfurase/selenocysteine lyase
LKYQSKFNYKLHIFAIDFKTMGDFSGIRGQFPALEQKVYGKQLIYFDNAATAQKPRAVLELIQRMNGGINANIHRAVHKLSAEATDLYEGGREAVRQYINAARREEVIMTSGTTASINLVANTYGERFLSKGDAVLVSECEHHSNIVPWQLLCERKGAELRVLPVDENGQWRMDMLDGLLDERVKIVSATHISNVLGLVNPVEDLIARAHAAGAVVLIDGAQGIVHQRVDVQKLDCDFYVFSGHKIYAATGIGILYGKEALLEKMPPWMGGGDMVGTVTFAKTTYAPLPLKFEAGTPNFIGGATLAPALQFSQELMSDKYIEEEIEKIDYLDNNLQAIDGLRLYGVGENKIPVFSFAIEGAHHEDLALLLDKMGVAVRSGMMCAEPLMERFGQSGMLRASLAPYNTLEECKFFMTALHRAVNMLR